MSSNADTETGSSDGMTDIAEAMLADRRRVAEDYDRAYQQLRKEAAAKGIVLPAYEHDISAVYTVADILPPDFVLEACEMRMPGFCRRLTEITEAEQRRRHDLEMRKVLADEMKLIVKRIAWTALPLLLLVGVVLSIVFR